MITSFAPSFQHFQKDIERFLKSEGKCEKNEHGQIVYRGYQAAVDQMFRVYIEKEAFAPLVAEFRTWNWEWNYDQVPCGVGRASQRRRKLVSSQGALGSGHCQAENQLQQNQEGSEGCAGKESLKSWLRKRESSY